DERTDILKVISLRVPFGQDVDLDNLAEESEGFSGADLDVLIRESSFNSLRENITSTQVLMRHIQPVLKKMRKANIRQPQNNINNTELVFNSGI
ncbi:7472_t:CDS:2, partial [Acaulospora morrowiae]